MRCLGQIRNRAQAEKFVAHLLTLEISTQIESINNADDQWEIWVRDEDRLTEASRELDEFLVNPDASKYATAIEKANAILDEREKKRREAAKNVQNFDPARRRRLTGGGGLPPLTLTLFILSIAIGLVTNFSNPSPQNRWGMSIDDQLSFVSNADLAASNGDPAASLKRGQIWRAITPIFRHQGILHLAMNMFMLVSFGRIVERWVGTPAFALMVLLLAICPNLFQGLSPEWMHGSFRFGGISGVLFGLFGYVWIRTSINPNHGISIPFPFVVMAFGIILLGLSGAIPAWRLADLCHLGGLLIGAALGFASEQAANG